MKTKTTETSKDENRDPITGEPGSHPVGTGVGAAGGAAAGAAIGSMGGPIGTAVGGLVGAIAGAAAGHSVAESIDPTAEDAYWNERYHLQPYYIGDHDFNDYGPAYRIGYEGYNRHRGKSFDEIEPELSSEWETARGGSRLGWERARDAARDGWHHVERALPGDADGDGR